MSNEAVARRQVHSANQTYRDSLFTRIQVHVATHPVGCRIVPLFSDKLFKFADVNHLLIEADIFRQI